MRGPRFESDQGSALVFAPAAVLVLIVLGAIAVDFAAVHLRQRELENIADAAANDAAAAAVDQLELRTSGEPVIDPGLAQSVIAASVGSRNIDGVAITSASVDDNQITVGLALEVDYIFGKAVGLSSTQLTATGSASLE